MTLSQVRLVKGVWLFASPTLLSFFPPWDTTQEILTQHERVHLGTSDQAVVQKWFAALSATWTSLDGWRLVQCLNSGDWKSISCRSRHVSCSSLGWLKDEADDIYIYNSLFIHGFPYEYGFSLYNGSGSYKWTILSSQPSRGGSFRVLQLWFSNNTCAPWNSLPPQQWQISATHTALTPSPWGRSRLDWP